MLKDMNVPLDGQETGHRNGSPGETYSMWQINCDGIHWMWYFDELRSKLILPRRLLPLVPIELRSLCPARPILSSWLRDSHNFKTHPQRRGSQSHNLWDTYYRGNAG